MSKELVIGSNRHETKVAILEEDQLVEVYFQRGNEYSLAGSIHKGRVTRVLPGMQSAFVDLGLERDTFLYVSDFFEENEDIDTVGDDAPVRREPREMREGSDRQAREGGDRRHARDNPEGREARDFRGRNERTVVERPVDETLVDPTKVRAIETSPAIAEALILEIGPVTGEAVGGAISESSRSETNGTRGDRGSRRGRRRRPRSGGFPDNKYAQPSSVAAPTPAATPAERLPEESFGSERSGVEAPGGERPSFERAYADRSTLPRVSGSERYGRDRDRGNERPNRREETTGESSPSEVIILPGESLAKYRRSGTETAQTQEKRAASEEPLRVSDPPASALESPTFLTAETNESEDAEPAANHVPAPSEQPSPSAGIDEVPIADLAEEHTAIKQEADELELSDRVFSHYEMPEISEDELVDIEIERIEPTATVEPMPVAPSSLESTGEREELADQEGGEPVHHQEFALPFESTGIVEVTPPVIVEIESLTTFGGSAPLGLSDEAIEDEDERDEVVSGEAQVSEPEQTATLRDQSGRSLHRVTRRNRRRRGGNRFGSSGDVDTAPAPAPGLGAVPTLQTAEPRRETHEPRTVERAERVMPSISDLLKAGQEIIVQIAKEPLGQKGARITSHIALPGRFVVFMPSVAHLGVSRKIASDEERQRLKQILQRHRLGTTGGFIVRTAGEGIPEDEIASDMTYLYNLWLDIRQKAEKKPAPALLHYDLDIVQRILRDHVTEDFKSIWVDNEEMYEGVLTFMQRFQPTLVSRVKMYTRSAPIFDAFNITQELEKALRPKVWLKSGGYIVINQTEALVAIDINTGKYVGKSNRLEDTIVKTNTEAVKEIVRQIRLRDLGGIIVVDFIDMDERKNRQKVMAALEEAMQSDKAPYKILQFNDFGLVAITRKRVKQSLERTLCSPCPYCEGAGYVKSVQTTIGEILIEAQKIAKAMDGKDAVLRVHPDVAKVLKASNNHFLEEMEETLGRPVLVTGDPTLHTEKFDLA